MGPRQSSGGGVVVRRPSRRHAGVLLAAALLASAAGCGGSDSSDDPITESEPGVTDDETFDDSTDDLASSAADPGGEAVGADDDTASDESDADASGTTNDTDDENGRQARQENRRNAASEPAAVERAAASRLAGARVLCSFAEAAVPQSVLDAIGEGRAGGVLLFASNVPSEDQAVANGDALRAAGQASRVGAPAIVAIDQEGGSVKPIPGPPSASAEEMGTWASDDIVAEGQATGELVRSWGVNLDLAPVADVGRPGGFIERQDRSFGSDLATAADGVVAFTEGLRLAGVASTLKHFPGLGSATLDTDDSVSVVETAPGDLWSIDFIPFAAGINVGADAVMMSSAVYPAVDDRPAVYSEVWVEDVLRGELGFGGVVMSDTLDTPALAGTGGVGARAVEAAKAGVDLLIAAAPQACGRMHTALTDAIQSGEIDESAARASLRRIDALRRSFG